MTFNQESLNENVLRFRELMSDPTNFTKTCDGGDPGSPGEPSIWLFGLEPGWSTMDQQIEESDGASSQREFCRYSIEMQLRWPFNRNAFKLFAAMKGESPENYVEFARKVRPFEEDYQGYFKGNLFPAACNNIGVWAAEHIAETGFTDKSAYQEWMRNVRLPILKDCIQKHQPQLFIGTGLTYLHEFLNVTGVNSTPEPHVLHINGHAKPIYFSSDGTVPVVIIPHLSGGIHSLNSFQSISETAAYINQRLSGH